jgi:transcriptional regulator with XRE-family HTH domain
MRIRELGEYIRTQRKGARLSLKAVSTVAGVSIPYLSQIERGLRKPSAEILQAIAKGLRISAETLYVQAGFLEDRPVTDVVSAIMGDPAIAERHKRALVEIYNAFREEAGTAQGETAPAAPARSRDRSTVGPRRADSKGSPHPSKRVSGQRSGGRAGTRAVRNPDSPPLRPPTTRSREEV